MTRWILGTTAAALVAFPMAAEAQRTEVDRAPALSAHAGAAYYNLEGGEGWAPAVAARWSIPFGTVFRAELGGSVAWPEQTFAVPGNGTVEDSRSLFVAAPEAMIQMSFGQGNMAPYIGVGGALTIDRAERQDGSTIGPNVGPSAAAGVRWIIGDQLGAVAEVRGRAVGPDFDRRMAELTLGLSWSLKPTPYVF
ncbi:MAG TPA: hypothetical protein VK929_09760 [Longimicrobiales bacterium]|nr:hypothetical protein [Longimicrobiales bacterium]